MFKLPHMQTADDCPEHIRDSLLRYQNEHVPTGGFLKAVLENNLREAYSRADSENIDHMMAIVSFCYNRLNMACWGTPDRVQEWLNPPAKTRHVIRIRDEGGYVSDWKGKILEVTTDIKHACTFDVEEDGIGYITQRHPSWAHRLERIEVT
jgi:hypothetical protein